MQPNQSKTSSETEKGKIKKMASDALGIFGHCIPSSTEHTT